MAGRDEDLCWSSQPTEKLVSLLHSYLPHLHIATAESNVGGAVIWKGRGHCAGGGAVSQSDVDEY